MVLDAKSVPGVKSFLDRWCGGIPVSEQVRFNSPTTHFRNKSDDREQNTFATVFEAPILVLGRPLENKDIELTFQVKQSSVWRGSAFHALLSEAPDASRPSPTSDTAPVLGLSTGFQL
jgi:hypothetical protein